MSPGGHAATTAVAAAAAGYATGSLAFVTGVAVGGFLIDLDHAVDYVLFNRQRDLRPSAFLRYYLEARAARLVLVLHSYELFALLGLLAWWTAWPPLWGYLLGAVLHLVLDIVFNGELLPTNVLAFYSFVYRALHRFRGDVLHGGVSRLVPQDFWRAFFNGPTRGDLSPSAAPDATGARAPDTRPG